MIKRLLICCLVALAAVAGFGKTGSAHIKDVTDIMFNSSRTEPTKELAAFISQGVDMGAGSKPADLAEKGSSFLNTLRKEFGSIPGAHRDVAHWGLSGAIPKKFLEDMEKRYPGCTERVVELWRQFVITRREAVKQALHLAGPNSDRAAQAIASMIYDIHLLGDHTTVATEHLKEVDVWVNDYLKSINRLLGNNNGLSQQIRQEIKRLPKTLTSQERAARILEILKSHNKEFSERLTAVLKRMGYTGEVCSLDYEALKKITKAMFGAEGVISQAFELVDDLKQSLAKSKPYKMYKGIQTAYDNRLDNWSRRMAEKAYDTFDNVYSPDALKSMKGVKDVKKVIGVLQRVEMKDGSSALVLSIPVENFKEGLKAGIVAGVVTLVVSEGTTMYQYFHGDITHDDFLWESGKNCADAILTGSATFVAVLLGASPAGLVVLGIGIGSYALCDIVFSNIRKMVEGPTFTLDDVMGELPSEIQRRKTCFDYSGYEAFLEFNGRESMFDYRGGESFLDYKPNNDSIFEF